MFEFKLPDLGEGIHEGEILEWHVAPGDTIEEDAALVDVETDKAAVTIPSPRAGTIVALHGEVGDVVNTGDVIVVIDEGRGEAVAAAEAPATPPAAATGVAAPKNTTTTSLSHQATALAAPNDGGWPVPAAPATRRLAREFGIDINVVAGSGPAGRVTPEDVRRHAAGGAPPEAASEEGAAITVDVQAGAPVLAAAAGIPYYDPEPMPDFSQWGPVETEPVRSIRRKIARKMTTAMVIVPHVVHLDEADVSALEVLRRARRDRSPDEPSLTLLSFVVKAVVAALKRHPEFNASLDPDREEIVYKRYYNVGLAADTPKGLMVPVVHDADRKSLLEVTAEIRALAAQARDGTIGVDALRGGTFTVTNVGPIGGVPLAPAINYPEVAILGMGEARDKAVVREGEIVARTMLPLTLSFDHRVTDGANAARFVRHVVQLLEDPERLLVEI